MSKGRAGRPRKLSYWTLINALADGRKAGKSVRQIARELHVHPDTIYSTAKHFEIDIPLVLRGIPPKTWQTAPNNGESTQVAELAEVPPKPVEPKPQPEKNLLRLTAADFCGPNRGDAGRASSAGSADKQLARYRRLKGY